MNPIKPLTPQEAAKLIMQERGLLSQKELHDMSMKRRMDAAREIERRKEDAKLFD